MMWRGRLAAGVVFSLLFVASFVATAPAPAEPRRLHTGPGDAHPDDHCMDVWENSWCQARATNADGSECAFNHVLEKCKGTCGACCADRSVPANTNQFVVTEGKTYCQYVHDNGLCERVSSDCMETCGICKQALQLDCDFERGSDVCFYEASTAVCDRSALTQPEIDGGSTCASTGAFVTDGWNAKAWTGPQLEHHKDHFLLAEAPATGVTIVNNLQSLVLTSPWGVVSGKHHLGFTYTTWIRDSPETAGKLEVEVLESGGVWTGVWASGTETDADWDAEKWAKGNVVLDYAGAIKVRFVFTRGQDSLRDVALDDIVLSPLVCGDGVLGFGEGCDDGGKSAKGCSAECQVDEGYACVGAPSVCTKLKCGDGHINGGEECDDGNKVSGDGCSKLCKVEAGYHCEAPTPSAEWLLNANLWATPGPSTCSQVYEGKPRIASATTSTGEGDEPISSGVLEVYYASGGYKGVCECGESWKLAQVACFELGFAQGKVTGALKHHAIWDDDILCDSRARTVAPCQRSERIACTDAITVECSWTGLCGDGFRRHTAVEGCDDGNLEDGDGCSAKCQVEDGWACSGGSWTSKDTCTPTMCGDAYRTTEEACDDGNTAGGDGCAADCTIEGGYYCVGDVGAKSVCTAIGVIRLQTNESQLEVLTADGWGAVCAEPFSFTDASVACGQLGQGFVKALSSADFVAAAAGEDKAGYIALHGTWCGGKEAKLLDCEHCNEGGRRLCENCPSGVDPSCTAACKTTVRLTCAAEP